ncbi:MAG: hypothetical protein LCH52_05555 [Bacteroidetes bacterium]|nr:hypothetical protein [Bacteroidota bacterium]
MTRNSDKAFRFDYRIEVSKDYLTVLFYTPYLHMMPSKSFIFRETGDRDYKLLSGNQCSNPQFVQGSIYPFSSIKRVCDTWLNEVGNAN